MSEQATAIKHVYALAAGPPWVIAASREEALALFSEEAGSVDISLVDQMNDDEQFTVFYSDPFEDDPVVPEEEPCGYDCESFHNHATMTCGEWAEGGWGPEGPVIREFEG